MKTTLYILIALFLTSCGSSYHLKRMEFHRRMAIALGADADSTKIRKTDTANLKPLLAAGNSKKDVNIDSLQQHCEDLIAAALEKALNSLDLAGAQPQGVRPTPADIRTKIITKIQREVCPTVAIDSTWNGTLSIQGKDYKVPVRVSINAKDGVLNWSFKLGQVTAPFVKEEITAVAEVKPSFWYDLKLVALGIFIGLVAALVFWMIRRAAGV